MDRRTVTAVVLSLFIYYGWLVIRGGSSVGAHLGLLGQYFPGYSVTWSGCILGFFYGFSRGVYSCGFGSSGKLWGITQCCCAA